MRALPLCLLAFSLTGCTMFNRSPSTIDSSIATKHPTTKSSTKASRATPIKLYKNAEELLGKPFRDLGTVSGESCQTNMQDSPATISTARKKMKTKAYWMKANAVLVHKCQIISGIHGCYQQAVCQGSALNVTPK